MSALIGARISDSDKLRILKAVHATLPDVKVFQMVPDDDNFSFIEEPVDVEKFVSEHKESALTAIKSTVLRWLPFRVKVEITWNRTRTVRRHFKM